MRTILAVLFSTSVLAAQTTLGMGSLRGTIVDPSDQKIPAARVTLTETSKGLVRHAESGSDGTFFFVSVLPGSYSLGVEVTGFAAEQMNGLRIDVGEEASIKVRLQLGEMRTN